jgi:hypothetical protein
MRGIGEITGQVLKPAGRLGRITNFQAKVGVLTISK